MSVRPGVSAALSPSHLGATKGGLCTIVPIQILGVTIALVQIGWDILDGLEGVIFYLFGTRVVCQGEPTPAISHGIDEEPRYAEPRRGHGPVVLVINTSTLTYARAQDRRHGKYLCAAGFLHARDGLEGAPVGLRPGLVFGIARVDDDRAARLRLQGVCNGGEGGPHGH